MRDQRGQTLNDERRAHRAIPRSSPGITTRLWRPRRQPIAKTMRDVLTRLWMRALLRLAPMTPLALRLAAWPLGPYKDKRALLGYMGDRPYVSPLAQVSCPNLQLARHCFIDDYVTIYAHPGATGTVQLAENVHIYRWSMIELGADSSSLTIGANTYLQAGCTLNPFVSSIRIGQNCMIAARCVLMPYQHGYADPARPMREQELTSRGDIVIEDDVWLGAQVCVMDGVTIGRGAIVGAGAVVTKDIPPAAIAVGVPARVVRMRHAPDQPAPNQSVDDGAAPLRGTAHLDNTPAATHVLAGLRRD